MIVEFRIYRDPWMDNGLENFYRLLEGLDSCAVELKDDLIILEINDQDKFTEQLIREILERRKRLFVIDKDEKTEEKKEIKKDFVLVQEEKKEGGKINFKEEIYKPEKVAEVVYKIIKNSKQGGEICILCGRAFEKKVKNLQQANYPFVTKIASLSGVRTYKNGELLSLKDYYTNLCPFCYLIGILEWTDDALIYRTFPGQNSFLFLPQFDTLKELFEFKQSCRYAGILNNAKRYSNIAVNPGADEVENTPGEFSTLLCFYEKFIANAMDNQIANEWILLNIPFGGMKNIRADLISISSGILNIIKTLYESGENCNFIYKEIFSKIYIFSEKENRIEWEDSGKLRETLSKYFLLDNFRNFTKTLLPRKGGYALFSSETEKALEELIFIWRWKKMGLPKEKLPIVKNVGKIIAKVSQKNVSLLYKLDKVRRLEEFWSVLRELARKLPGMEESEIKKINPFALDDLIQLIKDVIKEERDGWKEIRDLLVVYSSMFYAIEKIRKGGEQQ